ncbi:MULTISPECIES: hypothetical protein [Cupriavidus]
MLAVLAPRRSAIYREHGGVARAPRIANKCQCAGIANMPAFGPHAFAYLAFIGNEISFNSGLRILSVKMGLI